MGQIVTAPGARRWVARRWWVVGAVLVMILAIAGAVVLPAPEEPVRIESEVNISRTPQEVFDFVTTPGNWPKWHPSSLAVSGATDHPLQVGEQATEDYLVAGRRGRAVWTVIEREAPWRWKIEGHGQEGGDAWIVYTLTEQAGTTRFKREMSYRMPNLLAAMLDPLLTRKAIVTESAVAVQQLKQVLEREPRGS